ncbi:MAG: TlpA family protein disulfide reductase [Actinomycetota bacterium]
MRRPAALGIALVTACLSVSCTGGDGHGKGPPSPPSSPAVNATTAPLLPADAFELPDFTPDDVQQLMTQLHGTPVIVNIWGSWCGPCREEGPRLAEAARRYATRVQFLGIDVKDDRDAARSFMKQEGWVYPSVFDPTPNADIERQLGYFAQPVTIFFDSNGDRADAVSGPVGADDLAAGIRKILG